jgi:hypothetical protein
VSPYVRTVKTASGARAVQIVHSTWLPGTSPKRRRPSVSAAGRRPSALDRALAWEAMPLGVRRALENDGVLVGK